VETMESINKELLNYLSKENPEKYFEQMWDCISRGADCCTKNDKGRTVMHYAAQNGVYGVLQLLILQLKRTDLINLPDKIGKTPLIYVVENGYINCFQFLLSQGGNVSNRDFADNSIEYYINLLSPEEAVKFKQVIEQY
jgi:ankyrin repeat protein